MTKPRFVLRYRGTGPLPEDDVARVTQLPAAVHSDLVRATARPLSPAGVAGLRLGL